MNVWYWADAGAWAGVGEVGAWCWPFAFHQRCKQTRQTTQESRICPAVPEIQRVSWGRRGSTSWEKRNQSCRARCRLFQPDFAANACFDRKGCCITFVDQIISFPTLPLDWVFVQPFLRYSEFREGTEDRLCERKGTNRVACSSRIS